jgi:hypothetical protein
MARLKISPDFTVEDIHKIREYNYERRKNMTFAEYKEDLKKSVQEFQNHMKELKSKNSCFNA